jgi:hypothetical protein
MEQPPRHRAPDPHSLVVCIRLPCIAQSPFQSRKAPLLEHIANVFRQGDFERNELAQYQSLSNERPLTTFAEITRPALQGKSLAAPLEANPKPCLEYMPRRDPIC